MDHKDMPVKQSQRKQRFRRGVDLIPNLFTLAALFSGFYAMIMATKEQFIASSVAILVAIVLDGLDGRVARLMHSQSEFGAELDSLSDMVSFGVAPSLVMYIWSLHELGHVGWCVAFIYASCGALRLARFNAQSDTVSKRYFVGLQIPIPAGFIACVIWLCEEHQIAWPIMPYLLAVLAIVFALLQVSMVRYRSFKGGRGKGDGVPFYMVLLLVLLIVLIALDPPITLLVIGVIYISMGPVMWLWQRLFGSNKASS